MTSQGSFQAEHSGSVSGLGSAEAAICTVYVAPESWDASSYSEQQCKEVSLLVWHGGVPALRLHPEMHDFSLGMEKSEIENKPKKKFQECRERQNDYFGPFFARLCESPFSFINGSDTRKPFIQRETKQLERLAPRAPKKSDGEGEAGACCAPVPLRAALPWECGTAELAGGRQGVAVFEQGSGAITLFFFSSTVSSKHSSPPSPLSLHPTSLSFSPAHVFLFKGCSADEYDWHLQPPLDLQLKPLEWRRSWAAKGRAVCSLGLLGGWLSCGFMLLQPRTFLSEWEHGNHVGKRFIFRIHRETLQLIHWFLALFRCFFFFPSPFFLVLLSNVPLRCWVVGQRRLFLYGQPFGDMLWARVVCWFAWLWWQLGLLWIGWTEVALKEPWLEAGLRLAFSLPQVLMLALNPWSWSNMWWCPTMRNRRTLRSASRLEKSWMS